MFQDVDYPVPPMPWGWSAAFRIWRHNWIKRPWRNFLWRSGLLDGGEHVARNREHGLPPHYPLMGKINRADMEWAWKASHHPDVIAGIPKDIV